MLGSERKREKTEARRQDQERQFLAQLGPVAWEASRRHWANLQEILGPQIFDFVATKWRLTDTGWRPGDIERRPRSACELAAFWGMEVEEVRKIDAGLVTAFANNPDMKDAPGWGKIMIVPIDEAQAWWDEHYGGSFRPDGTLITWSGDFHDRHLRKSDLDESIARAGLPSHVADLLHEVWRWTADVEVQVFHGRPEVKCHVKKKRVVKRLLDKLSVAGAKVGYYPASGLLGAIWDPESGVGRQTPPPHEPPDVIPAVEGTAPPTGYFGARDQNGAELWISKDVLKRSTASTLLSTEQVERIRAFKAVFAEHDRTSLEEAVTNFQRDEHPEPEIRHWERMATVYSAELNDRPSAGSQERQLLFNAVLASSFGASDAQAAIASQPALKALPNLSRVIRRFTDEGDRFAGGE